MDDEAKPYLLTEAAGLTGLSVDALRKRIERKKLRGSRRQRGWAMACLVDGQGRRDGQVRTAMDRSSQDVDGQPDESRAIKALEAEVAGLRERAGRAEGELATLRERMESERARADRAEAERDVARAEREAAKVAAASAEGEARGLRLALEEARRPFWRRWLGP